MKKLEYTVRFVTPAFLGDAFQNGQWRTPPFKALIRQWWRVAEVAGQRPDTPALYRREGELFGRAADQRTTASQVRLRLDWRGGRMPKKEWNDRQARQFLNLTHPEVKDRNNPTKLQPVGTALYLGFGAVAVGNKLDRESTLAPNESRTLTLGVPDAEEHRFREVLRLAHAFGAVGSRCRNGWGSLYFETEGLLTTEEMAALLGPASPRGRDWLRNSLARDWRDALDTDWCHAVGKDDRGLLLWRTEPKPSWEEVVHALAAIKIAYRTQFHFGGGGPHSALCDRQVLAYPVTRHNLNSYDWERNANQILFKVLPLKDRFVGVIVHLAHGLPSTLRAGTGLNDSALRAREIDVWGKVHEMLDCQGTALGRINASIHAQSEGALKSLTRLP